jgi:DNA-binding transcriptional MerR regulator
MKEVYTTQEVLKLLKINRNCFQVWLSEGWIIPSIKRSERQGSINIFSSNDLKKIRVFSGLLSTGIRRKIAASLVKEWEKSNLNDDVLQQILCKFFLNILQNPFR